GSCSEALVRREALVAIGDGQPRLVKIAPDEAPEHLPGVVAHLSTCPSAGSLDVFIDPQLPRPLLLVVGDTPAAHTLVRLGAAVGSVGGSQEEIALATLAEIVAARHVRPPSNAIALPATATDPVCGMEVDVEHAMHVTRLDETTYYFCGASCMDAFRARKGQPAKR